MSFEKQNIDVRCGQLRFSDDVHEMDMIVREFKKDYERLSLSQDRELLTGYGLGLVLSSRLLEGKPGFRYWTSARSIEGMPGDTRVYLLYHPTYYATCILKQAYAMEENEQIRALFEVALSQAMHASMGRDFSGHGYDAAEGFNYTMGLFEDAEMYRFVESYPEVNREFTDAYLEAREYWKAKKEKKTT